MKVPLLNFVRGPGVLLLNFEEGPGVLLLNFRRVPGPEVLVPLLPMRSSRKKSMDRNSPPQAFLKKGVLKICSKFIGEHACRSVISITLLCNFLEIALGDECSPLHLRHIFRTHFLENTSGRLLLNGSLSFRLTDYFLNYANLNLKLVQVLIKF